MNNLRLFISLFEKSLVVVFDEGVLRQNIDKFLLVDGLEVRHVVEVFGREEVDCLKIDF